MNNKKLLTIIIGSIIGFLILLGLIGGGGYGFYRLHNHIKNSEQPTTNTTPPTPPVPPPPNNQPASVSTECTFMTYPGWSPSTENRFLIEEYFSINNIQLFSFDKSFGSGYYSKIDTSGMTSANGKRFDCTQNPSVKMGSLTTPLTYYFNSDISDVTINFVQFVSIDIFEFSFINLPLPSINVALRFFDDNDPSFGEVFVSSSTTSGQLSYPVYIQTVKLDNLNRYLFIKNRLNAEFVLVANTTQPFNVVGKITDISIGAII